MLVPPNQNGGVVALEPYVEYVRHFLPGIRVTVLLVDKHLIIWNKETKFVPEPFQIGPVDFEHCKERLAFAMFVVCAEAHFVLSEQGQKLFRHVVEICLAIAFCTALTAPIPEGMGFRSKHALLDYFMLSQGLSFPVYVFRSVKVPVVDCSAVRALPSPDIQVLDASILTSTFTAQSASLRNICLLLQSHNICIAACSES